MGKVSALTIVLLSLFLVSSVTANPNNIQDFIETFVSFASSAMEKMGSGGSIKDAAKGLVDLVSKGLGKMRGGRAGDREDRAKRSIHSSMSVLHYNKTDVQRLEMNKTWDKDHEQQETLCLVKENEIYWLEFMTSALIQLLAEMKRVLDGKAVAFKMSKDAYNQTGRKQPAF